MDNKSLLGIDDNDNAIRDQYELTVLMKDTNDDIRYRALQAGKTYQSVLAIAESSTNVGVDQAADIFRQLINIRACEQLLRSQYDLDTGTSYEYFNTYERIEARYKVERLLYDLLQENHVQVEVNATPCDVLSEV
ncbi:hypothetical protein [Microbulbifer magnicolonia]|uniref:hypothetical protein n=1 Tax=Microbulbifer magnicolonia TaxID=3109744 RepID=UPI002B405748|nr:hypothetical protein [Microbulbifer sp. GG15]